MKPSGKTCNAPFEEFDMNLYKPRANPNGFRTLSPRLLVWILAFFKILYNRLGKTDEYMLDWKDEVDKNLKTSGVTAQGVDHVWFVTETFLKLEMLSMRFALLRTLSTESLQSLSNTSAVRTTTKKPIPSQIPVTIKSPVKQTTSSPALSLVNHTDLLQLSNIESRITDMLQSIDKLNLENVLKSG